MANTATAAPNTPDTEITFGTYDWAEREPDRVALITASGEVTFGELGARVNQLSHAFRDIGIGRKAVVAAIIENGREYFDLQLSTGQIGAYLLPLNWHLTVPDLLYMLTDSGAQVLVADERFAQMLAPVLSELPEHRFLTSGSVEGWSAFADFGSAHPLTPPENREYGQVMAYTSGTTGRPKGVRRELADVSPEDGLAFYHPMLRVFGLATSEGIHLMCSPLYHAAPSGFATGPLHYGQTIVILGRFDAADALDAIERHSVTSTHMVPTHLHRIMRLPDDVRNSKDMSSLEILLHAGAPCPPELKREVLAWLGPIVWEYLGATEGFIAVASPETWLAHPGTIGRPLAPGLISILDDSGSPVADGDEGTIFFRTNMPFEYHNNPAATAASRVEGMVTVGDIGRFDADGLLYLIDRRVDLIVSGGVNIYPATVETALIGHPSVQDVGVIGVDDPEWGKSVLAVIQPAPGVVADDALRSELMRFSAENLASFMRPKRIEFLQDFPRSATGKVVRRALRDTYSADQGSVAVSTFGSEIAD